MVAALGGALAAPAAAAAPAPAGGLPQKAPMVLPGDGAALRASASGSGWIVAGRPGASTDRLAKRFGARASLPQAGIYRIGASAARDFAGALRAAGRLTFAEPDARATRSAFPSDPLTPRQSWLNPIVDPQLDPPAVTPDSPVLAVLDAQADFTHPEFSAGGNLTTTDPGAPVTEAHGTAVAGVAGAPDDERGIVGLWPGMRVRVVPNEVECSSIVSSVNQAVKDKVSVINMSYGFAEDVCFAHLVATQFAFGQGIVPVAAAGNEFDQGNPPSRPATDPHVVTVAAVDDDLSSAYFSNENDAIDLSAPGVDVLTTVPKNFDEDATKDGYQKLPGTSFSAPMVAAAAAWVRAVRPDLTNFQTAEALRDSARDLGPPGWERRFGHGLLDVGRALTVEKSRQDPLEPNDDVEWVNGRRFATDPPIFATRDVKRTVIARLDRMEDPSDVYRVRFPARGRLRVRVKPLFGDAHLEVFESRARTVYSGRARIGRSSKPGSRVETLTLTNPAASAASIFVHVYPTSRGNQLDAGYRLEVSRLP